jgi:GT2 family glycosyltransferase
VIEFDATEGRRVGYEELGPIIEKWALLLHGHLAALGPDAVGLFAARAGIRMRTAYERFLSVRGWEPPCRLETLWTSRLLAAKAALPVATRTVAGFMASEFRDRTVADLLAGLTRHEDDWRRRIPSHGDLDRPVTAFPMLVLEEQHPVGRFAGEYGAWYRERYTRYLEGLVGGAGAVAIIDSGWQGTVHGLIAPLLPGRRLVSLLAARAVREGEHPPHLEDVIGLLHEGPRFDATRPFSAIVHHRHLLESLFETPGASVEYLTESGGAVVFPQAEANLAPIDPSHPGDVHLAGVLTHMEDHADAGLGVIMEEAVAAEEALARRILFPDVSDVQALLTPPRSADFGRDHTVAVCLDPGESDVSRAVRLRRALWYQGQVALELEPALARPLFEKAVAGWDPEEYFHGHEFETVQASDRPGVVAIVTRTKDRPVLLRRAAASVASQSYQAYRWVVVNDGGDPDPVVEVIESSAVPPDRITFVSNSASVGMEAASNLGVKAVESDYVVIHDDDDSWEPSFLEEMVGFMDSPSGAAFGGVVCHSTYVSESVEGDEIVVHDRRPYNQGLHNLQLAELAMGNVLPPISFLFRRSVWEDLGGFDESLPVLGDWDFNLRALLHGNVHVIPTALANYHHRDVGDAAGFGNSVIAARAKHLEFSATYRNAAIRAGGEAAIGGMMATAFFARLLREEARATRDIVQRIGRTTLASEVSSTFTDELWIALNSIVGASARRAAKNPAVKWGSVPDRKAVARLARGADLATVPIPPDFDESAYLRTYPDVAQAVGRGEFTSGYHHFLVFGRKEGRARPVESGYGG